MEYFILTIIFIYGLLFGSFYNVVIYRMPNDLSISKGRSYCPKCKTTLRAFDLVPLFSYIFLAGKCRYCKDKISIRYPLIELFTGIYFAFAYITFGFSLQTLFMIIFWSYLFIVSMIDIDHKIILDSISAFFGIIFIIFKIYTLRTGVLDNFIAGVIAFFIYYLIYKGSIMYYKAEAFGLGDVFYIGVIGFCLGTNVLYLTLFFPFIVAFFYIIWKLIVNRKIDGKEEVPFGPFISISAFIISIYGEQMINFIFIK